MNPFYILWLRFSIAFIGSLLFQFVLGVGIAEAVCLVVGYTWPATFLGFAVALVSIYAIRILAAETVLDLLSRESGLSREELLDSLKKSQFRKEHDKE